MSFHQRWPADLYLWGRSASRKEQSQRTHTQLYAVIVCYIVWWGWGGFDFCYITLSVGLSVGLKYFNWGTLSRGIGLRSFRPDIPPEISVWGVFVGRRLQNPMRIGEIITYIVCSPLDVRIISVYVNMQPGVIFLRKVAIRTRCFLQNPMRIGKIITYVVCSLLDIRIISVYVYMVFIRKVAIRNEPLTDLSRNWFTDS